MGLLRGLLGARNLLLVILVPLLLLPLPILHPTSEAACAYVLIVTATYWVSEAVPLGAAALVPAFLYPFFGVLRSSEVSNGQFRIEFWIRSSHGGDLDLVNTNHYCPLLLHLYLRLLLCFMCCTTMLSMWLSNTSTTAMVMPIVEAVLQGLVGTEEEQLVAGSTSTEEAEPISLDENNSQPSLELIFVNEEWCPLSPQNLNGVAVITNPVQTATPRGKKQHASQEKPRVLTRSSRNQELSKKYRSQHDQMICKCLSLSVSYAATIGGLTTIIGTSTSLIFLEHFNNQYPAAEVVNFGTWFLFSFPISLIMLVVSWFWMHWLFLGCNFKETCSLSKKKKTKREELSEQRIQEEYEKLGDISYPEMVTGFFFILMMVLWFTREPGFVPGWDSFFEKKGYRTDATVSVFLGFLLFLIPAKKPCFGKKGDGEPQEPLLGTEPIITWQDFQKTMPWEIVILVGGGYALASGSKSETLHINPLYTLIPVTMCISFAVMLPVGNPPNAIVFSYGHCQIKDMVKAGLGVNVIGLVIVMVAINTWGISLFRLDTFPAWAKASNITDRA
ncbi:solute carrier family 13 member 4 [Orycteropus afer afer]|uniref:Solute carrier family 13 member 4 n=1 Tax=Orycteropus afer afer TaxID=1230840 RepID=A0AC54ZA39_ORYAF|nr:solute carrier family 13 member 4 [Orycteropus afer afer]